MSGGGTNTVTRTELDPTMRPFVQYGLSESQRLYQQALGPQGLQYFPGQTYISPSQQTRLSMEAAQQRASMGNPLVPAAQGQLQRTIQGEYLGANPYLQAALQPGFQAAERQFYNVVNPTLSNFSRAGRYGSGAMQGALGQAGGEFGRALTGAAATAAYQNYADERARQMAAIGAAPGLAAADYADIQQMGQIGQMQEAYQEMALQDAINRFNFQQQAPYSALQSYLSGAYGAPSGMQQVTPVYRNPVGSLIGGATAGYAAGKALEFNPQYGAAAGAALGLLG